MPDPDMLFMSAGQTAALIRARKLSPVEHIGAVLDWIGVQQPRLNAFVTVTGEQAMAAARVAEQAVMRGDDLGPLHGVAVNVKDLFKTKGVRTSFGSAVYADNVPDADDVLVTRLRKAGAIMVGKSTTPEFGHKGITDGPAFGISRNPWNPAHVTGGSSGGAAAAVAAGMGPLGLGTDGAGSVRIPAACCGVVGLKPTAGALPYEQAVDAFFNYAAAGPLTRTVADAGLMTAALAGPDPIDPWSLGAPAFGRMAPSLVSGDLAGARVGYIPRMGNATIEASYEANTRAVLAVFATAGADVEEVTTPVDWVEPQARAMYMVSMLINFGPYRAQWGNRMDPTLLSFIGMGEKIDMPALRHAQYARTRLYRAVQGLFETYDFLVSPTLNRAALPIDQADAQPGINPYPGWTSYMYPFNLCGHPAAAVPSGWAADGLPTSVQIVGNWWADAEVLRLASFVEQAMPWAARRPAS